LLSKPNQSEKIDETPGHRLSYPNNYTGEKKPGKQKEIHSSVSFSK